MALSALLFIIKIRKICRDFSSRNSVSVITTRGDGVSAPLSGLHRRGLCRGPRFPNGSRAVARLSCGELPGEGFHLLHHYTHLPARFQYCFCLPSVSESMKGDGTCVYAGVDVCKRTYACIWTYEISHVLVEFVFKTG